MAAPAGESTKAGWGPLLRIAFPPEWQRRPLSADQRTFLGLLVEQDTIWESRAQYSAPSFAEVGLPTEREACRTLAAS